MSIPSRHASGEALRPILTGQAPPGREQRAGTAHPTIVTTRPSVTTAHSRIRNPRAATHPPAALRTFATVLLIAVMVFTVTACGPDRGLKVSPEAHPSPSLFAPDKKNSGPPDAPFSLKEIRELIVDSSGVAVAGSAPETAKVVDDCDKCLKFSTPFLNGKKKFQLVTVANPKQMDETIAGAVISKHDGEPRLELIATGNQLTLSPGKRGTVVVQEAMFADGDDACCPSGWSVQVFRLHDGRFEPGQRLTRLNGET
ncbi:hypothetical protein [Brevibacterium oceani]|uniref:hypothetical protein n=1 Tax=Brevibacterium oceani TaxID=358099 RepID=UPI001FE470C4|nr:hypothetical protein [Brevibacterium oceani]